MKFKVLICTALLGVSIFGGVCYAADTEVFLKESAIETYESGTYYEQWNIWFDKSNGRITGYDGHAEILTLPSEIDGVAVVGIENSAFKGADFKKINLPQSLTLISYKAFENCTALTEITIPKNITTDRSNDYTSYYGNWFVGCTSLKKVIFEEGTTTILREALANSYVTDVVLPSTLTQINYRAFNNMTGLKSISLPESLTVIGEEAFSGCSSIESLDIPKYVSTIYSGAFKNCSSLKNIKLGNGITLLSYKVFENCTSLTEITIPKNVTNDRDNDYTSYYGNWFVGCTSLKKVIFEEGTTTILREALANSYVTDVVLPSTLTQINYRAFNNMTGLKSISLPESLTVIGEEAFSGCSSIESLDIPKYVSTIYSGAFKNCSSLKNIKLGNGITLLSYKVFENCTSLTEITIPKNVTNDRDNDYTSYYGNWFFGCTSLKKVIFEEGTTTILREALANSYVKQVVLPDSVENINYKAFSNCLNLTSIKIPQNLKYLGNSAFYGCNKLEKAIFTGNAPEITGTSTYDIEQVFKNCYVDFEINYLIGKTGWTEPEWNGYQCKGIVSYEETNSFIYGGANNTGRLEAADAAVILQKVLNNSFKMPIESETSDYMKYIDVDLDNKITAADSAAVLQKVLNSSFIMPVEK